MLADGFGHRRATDSNGLAPPLTRERLALRCAASASPQTLLEPESAING